MHDALGQLELFLHQTAPMPVLIFCALAHAQFETIHPFLDGNGRVGRLLITFLLCQREILRSPLLYLSHYLKQHRAEYYDRLTAIRTDGHWEQWVKYFLRGVAEVSKNATDTARKILALRETSRSRIFEQTGNSVLALRLLDLLFLHPITNIKFVREKLGCSHVKASQLMESSHAEPLALVEETTGFRRNRRYRFKSYLALFPEPPVNVTGSEGSHWLGLPHLPEDPRILNRYKALDHRIPAGFPNPCPALFLYLPQPPQPA